MVSQFVVLLVWLWAFMPVAFSQSPSSGSGIKYSDVTFIGAHNSLCVRTKENGFSNFGNQFHDVTTQLKAGVRMIQGQGYMVDGQIHICHTSCSFIDAGPVVNHLNAIKSFLQSNPNEVVTLLWVNLNNIPPQEWDKAYKQAGLDGMSYIPTSTNIEDWPLISEMVSSGKRLVNFMSAGANQQAVPYLVEQFNYVFETPFEVTSSSGFGCKIDRGNQPGTSLAMVNHFLADDIGSLIVPNASYASVTNSKGPGVGNLLDHARSCAKTFGKRINFLLLDFVDRGDPFEVADMLNVGIPKPSRTAPPTIPETNAAAPPEFLNAASGLTSKYASWLAFYSFLVACFLL